MWKSLVVVFVFVFLAASCLITVKPAWASSKMWSQTYGGANDDSANAIVQTSDGGYALTGYTRSFGAGSDDFWLVKTDANGKLEWNQTYGGTKSDIARSLVETSDGGYALTGYTRSFGAGDYDFWLVKTDRYGNIKWNQTYGGAFNDLAHSLIKTSDGGFALTGYTISFGAGPADFWLVKTDSNGNMQWNKTYGGANYDRANSLVETSDGGFALAGSSGSGPPADFWLVKTDSNGNMQWNKTYGGTDYDYAYSLVETSDRGYALAGYTSSFGVGNSNYWLVKSDMYGNMEWNQIYGEADYNRAYSLVETSDGGFALAGSSGSGFEDFWLVKTDSNGNMQWNKTYNSGVYDRANSLVETSDGGFALAGSSRSGYFQDEIKRSGDFWLVKTDEYAIVPEFPSPSPSPSQSPEPIEPELFPTILIIAAVATVVVIGIGLLIYFKRRKH
jgi:hypothetical protein